MGKDGEVMEFCKSFGNMDGMDGSCHYCREESPEMWQKCWDYKRSPNRKELAELAALREENDQLKTQIKHEVDKVKSGCEYWRRRCLDAEAQVAGLQELYKNSIGIIEKTLLDGSIDYMELQKQIDAYTAYALSPDPGEKYRKVIEAAIQKVEADKKDIPFNKWTIFSDELTQAVEALKEGD